jgi:hypothetical protein
MAVSSAGELLVNAFQLSTSDDLEAAVEVAKASGLRVFVGVAVPLKRMRAVMKDIDNAAADIVGRHGAELVTPDHRRRRDVARKISRTPSRTSSGAPSKRRPAS